MFIVVFGPCFVVQYLVSFISLRERERERERVNRHATQGHIICTSLSLSLNLRHRFDNFKPRFQSLKFERKGAH